MPFNIGKLVESASKRLSFGSPFPQEDDQKVAITGHGRHTKTLALISGNPSNGPSAPAPPKPPVIAAPGPTPSHPPVVTDPSEQLKPAPKLPPTRKKEPNPPPFSPTAPVGGFSASLVPELKGAKLHKDVGLAYIYTEGTRMGEVAGTRPASSSPFKPKLTFSICICSGIEPPCGYSDTFLPAYLQDGQTKCFGLVNRSKARFPKENQHDECMEKLNKDNKLVRIGTELYQVFPLLVGNLVTTMTTTDTPIVWDLHCVPHPHTRGNIHLKDRSYFEHKPEFGEAYVQDGFLMTGPCRPLSRSCGGAWASMADFRCASKSGPPHRNGGARKCGTCAKALDALIELDRDYPLPNATSDLWYNRFAPMMVFDTDATFSNFPNPCRVAGDFLAHLRNPKKKDRSSIPADPDDDADGDAYLSCDGDIDDDSFVAPSNEGKGGNSTSSDSNRDATTKKPEQEVLIYVYQPDGTSGWVTILPSQIAHHCAIGQLPTGQQVYVAKASIIPPAGPINTGFMPSPIQSFGLSDMSLGQSTLTDFTQAFADALGASLVAGQDKLGQHLGDTLNRGVDDTARSNTTPPSLPKNVTAKDPHKYDQCIQTTCIGSHWKDSTGVNITDATETTSANRRINEAFATSLLMGPVAWYLGVCYSWGRTSTGKLTVQLSQEGCINKMLGQEGLEDCIAVDTPCRSGLTIDRVPHDGVEPSHKQMLVKKYASSVGGLNWLSTSTRPDITTATSLLASHLKNPSEGHVEAGRHVLKCLKGCSEWGIRYTQPDDDEPDTTVRQMRGEVAWPVDGGPSSGVESMDRPTVETDADWGPQDASKPKPGEMRKEEECRSVLGAVVIYLGGPLDWCATREKKTSRSTCDAEIEGKGRRF